MRRSYWHNDRSEQLEYLFKWLVSHDTQWHKIIIKGAIVSAVIQLVSRSLNRNLTSLIPRSLTMISFRLTLDKLWSRIILNNFWTERHWLSGESLQEASSLLILTYPLVMIPPMHWIPLRTSAGTWGRPLIHPSRTGQSSVMITFYHQLLTVEVWWGVNIGYAMRQNGVDMYVNTSFLTYAHASLVLTGDWMQAYLRAYANRRLCKIRLRQMAYVE